MKLPENTKAVLFDMDGVIFNTEDIAHRVFESFAVKNGKIYTEDDHKAILGTSEQYWSRYMCESFQLPMTPPQFCGLFWQERNKLIVSELAVLDGLQEFVDKILASGIQIALVTSTPRAQAQGLLERFGLFAKFSVVVTGDQVKNGKPDPEPYLKAIEQLGVHSSECVVIEDAVSGVKSGKSAGCYVIAVPTKHAIGLDYSEADLVIKSLKDME